MNVEGVDKESEQADGQETALLQKQNDDGTNLFIHRSFPSWWAMSTAIFEWGRGEVVRGPSSLRIDLHPADHLSKCLTMAKSEQSYFATPRVPIFTLPPIVGFLHKIAVYSMRDTMSDVSTEEYAWSVTFSYYNIDRSKLWTIESIIVYICNGR